MPSAVYVPCAVDASTRNYLVYRDPCCEPLTFNQSNLASIYTATSSSIKVKEHLYIEQVMGLSKLCRSSSSSILTLSGARSFVFGLPFSFSHLLSVFFGASVCHPPPVPFVTLASSVLQGHQLTNQPESELVVARKSSQGSSQVQVPLNPFAKNQETYYGSIHI